jgi:hypothetical protein
MVLVSCGLLNNFGGTTRGVPTIGIYNQNVIFLIILKETISCSVRKKIKE